MPSLFTALGRIMSGKPVFNPNDQAQSDDQAPAGQSQAPGAADGLTSTVRKGDANTFPVVQVKRVETRPDGDTVQVYCYICNSSPEQLVLDKIQLLGTYRRLGNDLQPNEERECLAYNGPAPQSPQYPEALLNYKTASGDYFEAVYEVIFSYQQESKTYTISELRLRLPIRDIYG